MSLNHCSWQNQLQPSGRKSKYFLSMFPTHTPACPPISTKVTPCTLHKGGKIILTIKLIWFVVFLDKVFEGLRVSSHQPAKKPFWIFFGSKEWIDQMWGKFRNRAYNLHAKIFSDYLNSFKFLLAGKINSPTLILFDVIHDRAQSWPPPPLEHLHLRWCCNNHHAASHSISPVFCFAELATLNNHW